MDLTKKICYKCEKFFAKFVENKYINVYTKICKRLYINKSKGVGKV